MIPLIYLAMHLSGVHTQRTIRLHPLTVQPLVSKRLRMPAEIQPTKSHIYLQPYGYNPQGEL